MTVRGYRVDSISTAAPISESREDPAQELDAIKDIVNSGFYLNGESMKAACERTLMADLNNEKTWASGRHYGADLELLTFRHETLTPELQKRRKAQMAGMKAASCERRFIRTPKGYMGLAPAAANTNDYVCVLYGGTVCYVLREQQETSQYKFVGECYLHGCMDGEMLDFLQHGQSYEEVFALI